MSDNEKLKELRNIVKTLDSIDKVKFKETVRKAMEETWLKKNGEIEDRIAAIKKEREELKEYVDRDRNLSYELSDLEKTLYKNKKKQGLSRIKNLTNFKDCEFPSMGYYGVNGSCNVENEEQLKELCKQLNLSIGYGKYYYYKKYEGSGDYLLIPDWKYDHDGDIVYKGEFIKK